MNVISESGSIVVSLKNKHKPLLRWASFSQFLYIFQEICLVFNKKKKKKKYDLTDGWNYFLLINRLIKHWIDEVTFISS